MAREPIRVLTADTHLKKATCCIKGSLTSGVIFKEGEYYYLFQDEPGLITVEKKDKPKKSIEILSTDNITLN